MTRYFICSILFLAIWSGASAKSSTVLSRKGSIIISNVKGAEIPAPATTGREVPIRNVPVGTGPREPIEKGHGHSPKLDETPHIHHFHKHRVKKLKRHHPYWILSKLLLVVCHLALLILAYSHAAH